MNGRKHICIATLLACGFGGGSSLAAAAGYGEETDPHSQEALALQLMRKRAAVYGRAAAIEGQIEKRLSASVRTRFFGTSSGYTGTHVDGQSMRVERVIENSPAALAGLKPGDRILEVNGYVAGKTEVDNAALLWAFRRLNPGDIATVTYARGEQSHTANVDVISREDLNLIAEDNNQLTAAELARRAEARAARSRKVAQYRALAGFVEEAELCVWDGLLLWRLDKQVGLANGADGGVLVLASADPDHALKVGDVVTKVGRKNTIDAQTALDLLYAYRDQPLVPLEVRRNDTWLHLELPYPEVERLNSD